MRVSPTKLKQQPGNTRPNRVIPGQRPSTIGISRKVPLWAQASLKINTPGDQYEQEANRVAEQVMKMPGTVGLAGICEDCKQKQLGVQRMAAGDGGATAVPPIVHQVLQQPGKPLDGRSRNFMESRFGQDFAQVRVHTNNIAANSTEAINAHAYTVGQNIVFGEG